MKHEVKRLISFVALLAMMVSMISVCVFPAAASADDAKYEALLYSAKVVNPAWENVAQGAQVSYVYRGETVQERFDAARHFASYDEAWEQIEKENRTTTPTVLLCAGTYDKKIELKGAVNLIGPNAGVDAVEAASTGAGYDSAWAKNPFRSPEAVIASNIIIRMAAKEADFTFDGLAFTTGGAIIDVQRGNANSDVAYNSEMTFKNLVFENAGNIGLAAGNAINLDSKGVKRIVHMDNIYVTGQNLSASAGNLVAGFISPYYAELYAKNIAYVDCKSGFLAISFAEGSIIPVIEVSDSCFYNAKPSATGYVISMDNMTCGKQVSGTSWVESPVAVSSMRAGATLKLHNNVFHNASSASKGVIHFELVNKNTVVDMQDNYFYSEEPTSVLELEFGVDSFGVDQSSCFVIRNNRFVGTYKIPSLAGSNESTYIDMSNNYFGDVNGKTVYVPSYVDPDFQRLIRTSFWIDKEMTVASTPWNMSINDWPLASVDTTHYVGELSLYNEDKTGLFAANFSALGKNTTVKLYKRATVVSDSTITVDEKDRIDQITDMMLPDSKITVYAKVENSDYPGFAPVYAITVEKIGSLVDMPDFNKYFTSDTFMYHPELGDASVGTVLPMKWNGVVYKMTVGKNLFGSDEKLFSYAKNNGVAIPTILLPAGAYTEEIKLYGSCVVKGAMNGVNPNKKPYEVIGENDLLSSAWSLNELWANSAYQTTMNAPIRVDESADDFIITLDGIKFGVGGGIVEDVHREKSNALVVKNVLMDNAGGFTNKAGGTSNYLFDFTKTFGVSNDFLSVSLSDVRIINTGSYHVFSSFVERLEMDGLYMGTLGHNRQFLDELSARNISDPYVGITNCYFDRTAYGMDAYVLMAIDNTNGDQAVKNNIVYKFDNNVFFDAFPGGKPLFDIKFTGTNMRFIFTNNIVYDEANNGDIFTGAGNFVGDCAQNDVSDMIVVKGNRFIRWRRLPLTTGTAIGTQFDFSGNYFSDGIGEAGLDHIEADFDSKSGIEPNTPATSLEPIRRRRLDYTYLDWNLTVRSDAVLNDASYTFNKGMFGNGRYGKEPTDSSNVLMTVFREDNVPADCAVYELPFTVAENATAKIYTSSVFAEDCLVDEMRLTSTENHFYVQVTSADGSATSEFKIIITRKENTESALLRFDNFLIDEANKTVTGHLNRRYIYVKNVVEVSNGATFAMYNDAKCTIPTADSDVSFRPTATTPIVKYIKVTDESGENSVVYTLKLNYYNDIKNVVAPGVSYIEDAKRVGNTNFEMIVSPAADEFTFRPVAYLNSALTVYNGNEVLTPDANGVYAVTNIGGVDQTIRIRAVSGASYVDYYLNVEKKASSSTDLLDVEGAVKTESGFAIALHHSTVVELDVTVAPGASYKVYSDYACKNVCAEDRVILSNDNKQSFAYVKVTSEDGKFQEVHKVTLLAQPGNKRPTPVVTATVGKNTYTSVQTGYRELTIYLPKGTKAATLSAKYDLVGATDAINLFADPNCSKQLTTTLNLNKKINKAYLKTQGGAYSFDRLIPVTQVGPQVMTLYGVSSATQWTINVVANQDVVKYRDASNIAAWAKPFVDYLNEGNYKIFEGDALQNFNGSSNITRNEIAVIATSVMGLDITKYSDVQLNFADSVAAWALPYVKAAVANKIISGAVVNGATVFNGYANASREQVITIFVSMLALQEGITDVKAYYLAHENEIDRDYVTYNFVDDVKVSDWAAPYVHMAVVRYELISGSPVGGRMYMNPQNNITRAEVAKIVACMLGY